MRSRSRSIRFKLVLLLLVPLLSLTALWGFSAGVTLGPGLSLLHAGTLVDFAKTTDTLSGALQDERRAAAVQSARPGVNALRDFTEKRRATDRAGAAFFAAADGTGVRSAIKAKAADDIDVFRAAVNALDGVRRQVAGGHGRVSTVMDAYTTALDDSYQVTGSTIVTFGDADFARRTRDMLDFARARDTLAQEDAVAAAMLVRGGRMTAPQHARFAEALGVQRHEYAQVVPTLGATQRKRYARVVDSPQYKRMRGMENRIADHTRHGGHIRVMPQEWQAATSHVLRQQQTILRSGADELAAAGRPLAYRILGRLAVTALFGLIAVVVSLVISVRMSRALIRELSELRHSAREVAGRRLPAVVRRLRRGERIDIEAEVVAPAYRTREITQVGAAIGSVQRTAMEEAVGEARLRTGIRDVFVNLARRSQALLHRQLKLLDGMERRTEDPEELDELFQLDHLATRMRRHAEGLIILSGSTPGRTWRRPVPLVDVVRAAVAEVEDYPRVTVQPMPDAALSGAAVADVVHLVAELVENATLYSPPHTEVRISAEPVGGGYVVEIDDRGLSMSADDLAAANQRLSDPPEFDLSDSARLGLFVVGRLARRHGIRVSLRVSPYGGTTAVVLLPGDLVITDETTVVDTGPYGERLHPAGVAAPAPGGEAAAREPADSGGPAPSGHLRVATYPDEPPSPERLAGPIGAVPEPDGSAAGSPEARTRGDVAAAGAAGDETRDAGEPGTAAAAEAAVPYGAGRQDAAYSTTANGLPRRVRTRRRDVADAAPFAPAQPDPDTGPAAPPPVPEPLTGTAWDKPALRGENHPPRAGDEPRAENARATHPGGVARNDGVAWGGGTADGSAASAGGVPGDVGAGDAPAEPVRGSAWDKPRPGDGGAAGVRPSVWDAAEAGPAAGDTGPPAVPPSPADAGERPELPRRVRQASLAPQLRTDVKAGDLESDLTDTDPGARSPEEARAMMTSIQRGWVRGRAERPGGGEPRAGDEASEEPQGPGRAGWPAEEEES